MHRAGSSRSPCRDVLQSNRTEMRCEREREALPAAQPCVQPGESLAGSDPLQNTLFSPASDSPSARHPWAGKRCLGGRVRTQPGTPITCRPGTHIILGQDPAGGFSWVLTAQYQSLALALGEAESRIWPLHHCSPQPPAFWLLEPGPSMAAAPPEAAQRVIFYRESIVLASVLQTALRRVCYQSWAALINLVCEAVFSALVNVRYYLPESLL